MTTIHEDGTHCGPAIACGAAYVTLDHKPGQPTSVDIVVAAIKRLFARKPASADRAASTNPHTDHRASKKGTTAQSHAL